jgi:hypothetical protein
MTFEILWPLLVLFVVPLLVWWVQRAVNRMDKDNEDRDKVLVEMQSQIHQLELKIAGDLATKEDMDKVTELLTKVHEMVIRMEERGKI